MNEMNRTKRIRLSSSQKQTQKQSKTFKQQLKSVRQSVRQRQKQRQAPRCVIGLKPFVQSLQVSNTKQQFIKQMLGKFAPNSIQPEDDFYNYINYQWLKNITLEEEQKYIVQIDDFRLSQDRVYHRLDEIILDYIKHNHNRLATNLRNFYDSVIHMSSVERSRGLALDAVKTVDDLLASKQPWKLLAHYSSDEMTSSNAPFVWSLNPDDKDPTIFRCCVDPHRFICIDLNVYYDDGKDVAYKANYRKEYKRYVSKVFETCLSKDMMQGLNPSHVFEVEKAIFDAMGCSDVAMTEDTYNKVMATDCKTKYSFDWTEYARNLGFEKTPPFFIASSLNYLKCGTDLFLQHWDTPAWRTYWVFLLLRRIVRITRQWETISYDFYGKFERGQERINKSDAVSASLYMSVPFNTFLTEQYMARYAAPETTEYVTILSRDLLQVFKHILEQNTWLAPKTKKYALYKLSKFKFIIGKPDNLQPDPDLDYTRDLYDNLMKINDWRHNRFVSLEGKSVIDIPMMDWTQYPVKMIGTQAYIVNASYTPSKNAIYINQGYIQKPFVDLEERGIEYNLAHIGFTLGHEMSHAFDDWGSKYDAEGKLHDWWTPVDKRKFKRIQNDIVKQYEDFAKRDGITFDASIGLGEDMADISGLAVCDNYLRYFQTHNSDIVPIKQLGFEAFYTYFALQQRQFVGKRALSAQLKTNPHPLDKYRCNIPLSRSDIFRAMYNVKKGEGMWWHNTNTVW